MKGKAEDEIFLNRLTDPPCVPVLPEPQKGALSRFIEDAVKWRLFDQTVSEVLQAFADVPPGGHREVLALDVRRTSAVRIGSTEDRDHVRRAEPGAS